jgi:hypothetical protein
MTIYAKFNDEGLPEGFYTEGVHGPLMKPVYSDPVPVYGEDDEGNLVIIRYDEGEKVGEERNPLIPDGVVEITRDQWVEFLSNQGRRRWNGVVVEPYEPPTPPVDLAAYAAEKRWQMEVSGTTWNGWPIHTDRESQGKYLSELQAVSLGIRQDGEFWKFADNQFRPLTNAEMEQMAVAARAHVKGSFAREALALQAIASGEATTVADIDIFFAQEA